MTERILKKYFRMKKFDFENVYSIFGKNIVTEVKKIEEFYYAEDYHQDFEKRNPNHRYIIAVSIPRLNRFKAKFPELLKEDEKH